MNPDVQKLIKFWWLILLLKHSQQYSPNVPSFSEPPVTIVGNSNDHDQQELMTGDDLILACEVSRADAPVQWYCNDRLLTNDSRTLIESYGTLRKIIISNAKSTDSGKYVCDAVDDKMISHVRVQGTFTNQTLSFVKL